MAHPNIEERRAAVQQALASGSLTGQQRRALARRFSCHVAAIRADVMHFTHPRKRGQTYHVSAGMRRRIRARDNDICQYCGCVPKESIIEHIIPASQGGLATPENLVVACQSCNMWKAHFDKHNPVPAGITADERREALLKAVQSKLSC